MQRLTYADGIRSAYRGELIGDRLYRLLSGRSTDPRQRVKFLAIADVERCTHRALKPIADRFAIEISEEDVQRTVDRRAVQLSALTWSEFIRKASVDWPPYVTEFQALRELAPCEDSATLSLLVLHEEVLVEFVHAELLASESDASLPDASLPDASLRHLQSFLQRCGDIGA